MNNTPSTMKEHRDILLKYTHHPGYVFPLKINTNTKQYVINRDSLIKALIVGTYKQYPIINITGMPALFIYSVPIQ